MAAAARVSPSLSFRPPLWAALGEKELVEPEDGVSLDQAFPPDFCLRGRRVRFSPGIGFGDLPALLPHGNVLLPHGNQWKQPIAFGNKDIIV